MSTSIPTLPQGPVHQDWAALNPPPELVRVFEKAPSVLVLSDIDTIVDHSCGGKDSSSFEVAYDVPGKGRVVEARVARVRSLSL